MNQDQPLSFGRLLGVMALFVLLGMPLVGYVWETLNRLLAATSTRCVWPYPCRCSSCCCACSPAR